jgi:hypothetical protein
MSSSIFDQNNEEYLRKFIESDERLESEASVALERAIAPTNDIRQTSGNKSISVGNLPSKGIFYPKDLVIAISPLKVKHIRHFSTIDETDELDISSKLNFVVNSSISVQTNAPGFNSSSLLEIDRLYLLLLVRNITFIEFPSIIKLQSTCDECDHVDSVDVKAERLGAMKEGALDDYLKMYSSESRSIEIKLNDDVVRLYLPSMHNLGVARKNIMDNQVSEEDQDRFMLCFLVPPGKNLTDKDFESFERELEDWSPDRYAFVKSFINTVNSSYSIDVYYKCSGCGAGVATPLRFHRGIKELFVPELSNRSDGLLQDKNDTIL